MINNELVGRGAPLAAKLLAASFLFAAGSSLAGPLPKPSDVLRDPLTESFEGKLSAVVDGDLVFELASGEQIAVGAAEHVYALLSPGTEYRVAYSRWMRSPLNPKAKQAIPSGPAVVSNPGLEPAVFLATADSRALWKAVTTADRASAGYADQMRSALHHADSQIVALAAAEWIVDETLRASMSGSVKERLAEIAENPNMPASLRSFVLASAGQLSPALGADWWQPLATKLLSETAVDGIVGYGQDTLIKTALNAAAQLELPYETYARWVSCANGGIAETALMAIRRHAPEREEEALEAALGQSLLAQKTRSLLVDHRRRLHLMNASKNTATAQQRGTQ